MAKYVIGVDVGQAVDYTAITVVRLDQITNGETSPFRKKILDQEFVCILAERLHLGTSFKEIIRRIKEIHTAIIKLSPEKVWIAIDKTGYGRAFLEFAQEGLNEYIIGIEIHGGKETTDWSIPKKELATTTLTMLNRNKLFITPNSHYSRILQKELYDFRVILSEGKKKGHEFFEAKEGEHDDLVLSLFMAVYTANRIYPFAGGDNRDSL